MSLSGAHIQALQEQVLLRVPTNDTDKGTRLQACHAATQRVKLMREYGIGSYPNGVGGDKVTGNLLQKTGVIT